MITINLQMKLQLQCRFLTTRVQCWSLKRSSPAVLFLGSIAPHLLLTDQPLAHKNVSARPKGHWICLWCMLYRFKMFSQVWFCTGIRHQNPEGSGWESVQVPREVAQVSAGPKDLLWVVLWDGQLLVRTGISKDCPKGLTPTDLFLDLKFLLWIHTYSTSLKCLEARRYLWWNLHVTVMSISWQRHEHTTWFGHLSRTCECHWF